MVRVEKVNDTAIMGNPYREPASDIMQVISLYEKILHQHASI